MESSFNSLKEFKILKGHKEKIWCLAWHPKGDLLVSCSGDKTIRIWTPDPLQPDSFILSNLIDGEQTKTIRTVAWSNDGKFLASGSFDASINIYHFFGGKFNNIAKLEAHENEIKCLAWDSSNTYLASCSRDKTIMLWDYEKQDNIYDFSCVNVLNGHDQDIKFVKWKPDSLCLFSASYDDTIKVWEQDEDEWICAQTLKGHGSTVWSLDFSPDGRYMVSVSDDQTIKIWDISAKEYLNGGIIVLATLSGYHDRCIYSCSFNNDSEFLATAGGDNSICLFQRSFNSDKTISYTLIEKKEMAHENDVNCVAFNPISNILASCSDDYHIKLWKVID